jgi:hypothetical protein
MKSLFSVLIVLLGLTVLEAKAQEAAPTAGFSNVFGCKLNEGKTLDNVWSTMEALAKMPIAWRNGPDPAGSVFLWTPFRTQSDFDYIWGYNSTDLNRMAQDLEDYVASPGAEAMQARLADTGDCASSIVTSRTLRTGTLSNTADRVPDATVETFACSYKDGKGAADLDKAIAYWQPEVEKIASPGLKAYSAWLWTPHRGTTLETDVFWIGAYPDLESWAEGDTSYYASATGQAIDARINAVVECRSSLWTGYWIVPPAAPAQ